MKNWLALASVFAGLLSAMLGAHGYNSLAAGFIGAILTTVGISYLLYDVSRQP